MFSIFNTKSSRTTSFRTAATQRRLLEHQREQTKWRDSLRREAAEKASAREAEARRLAESQYDEQLKAAFAAFNSAVEEGKSRRK